MLLFPSAARVRTGESGRCTARKTTAITCEIFESSWHVAGVRERHGGSGGVNLGSSVVCCESRQGQLHKSLPAVMHAAPAGLILANPREKDPGAL
jgi:hypothetical protein